MELEVLCDAERIKQFAAEWFAFASSQARITPFQLPDWLISWWSYFGSGLPQLYVFRSKECVGVLPCFLHQWNGARQLTMMGSGITDYLDPIFARSQEAEILNCIERQLKGANDLDICDWQDLSYDTPLESLKQPGWTLEKREEVPSSEVRFAGTFEQFWAQRPRHLRRNVRRYGTKARESGSVAFDVTSQANSELVDALIRLHGARWSTKGEPGMIRMNHSAEFIRDVARRFAAKNMLRIFSLRYDDKVAAIILGFLYQGTVFGYLAGFDPAYKQFSVASVLLYEAFQECYRQGYRAWNFCRGDEPYKFEWGAQPVRRCRLVLQRNRS